MVQAYSSEGTKRRHWVRKEPVAGLYKMLHAIIGMQKAETFNPYIGNLSEFFEQTGKNGELATDLFSSEALTGQWVSRTMAFSICQRLHAVISTVNRLDIKRLEALVGRDVQDSMMLVALYGYWTSNQAVMQFITPNSPNMPWSGGTTEKGGFKVTFKISAEKFLCEISKKYAWNFELRNWLEWLEINELILQSKEGVYGASYGRFSIFMPPGWKKDDGRTCQLVVGANQLLLDHSGFSSLLEIIELVKTEEMMMAFADQAKTIYGNI